MTYRFDALTSTKTSSSESSPSSSFPIEIYNDTKSQWWIQDAITWNEYVAHKSDVDLFFTYPGMITGWLRSNLGQMDNFPLPSKAGQPLPIDLTPPGGQTYGDNGVVGISVDAFYSYYLNVYAGWAYILIAHEIVNVYTGQAASGGWPTDWWADDQSPFPLVTGMKACIDVNWLQGAAACQAHLDIYVASNPLVKMFDSLYSKYGDGMFSRAFAAAKADGINWENIGGDPSALLTNYVAAYLLIGGGGDVASILSGIVPNFNPAVAMEIEQARTNLQSISKSDPRWTDYLHGNYQSSLTSTTTITQFTITVNTTPPGIPATGSGTYPPGSIITISVGEESGYAFQNWIRDGSFYTSSQSFNYTVDASHTFTANFQIRTVPVTIDTVPNTASITIDGKTYTNGQTASVSLIGNHTITANPLSGYAFLSWLASGGVLVYSSAATATMRVNDPGSLAANFQPTQPSSNVLTSTTTARLTTSTTARSAEATSSATNVGIIVTSVPTGLNLVVVDGVAIGTPHAFSWALGSSHTLSANSPVSDPSGNQYVWASWSDGGAQSHIVTASVSMTYTASFERTATTTTPPPATTEAPPPPSTPATQPSASSPQPSVSSPRCIIATAAYGSEIAPDVIYMRYVRDNLIGSTVIGRSIIQAWNTFYYSWSPTIAQVIAGPTSLNPASILLFSFASLLCGLLFIDTPAFLIIVAWRRLHK
jgi:hypothetical protein